MNPETRIYFLGYPGTSDMCFYHDKASELYRWFRDYREDSHYSFASTTEFLMIEAVPYVTAKYGRERVRYVGTIGDDETPVIRLVRFSPGAPPPPTFYVAAPTSAKKMRELREREMKEVDDYRLNYERVRSIHFIPMDLLHKPITVTAYDQYRAQAEYQREWAQRDSNLYGPNLDDLNLSMSFSMMNAFGIPRSMLTQVGRRIVGHPDPVTPPSPPKKTYRRNDG